MSGIVIGLVALILLLVVGAVVYFAMQEEEVVTVAPAAVAAPVVAAVTTEVEDTGTFDIVNGWIYDNEYNYMIGLDSSGGLKIDAFNEDVPVPSAKWSFEADGDDFMITSDSKNLKITNSDVQVTTSSSSSSKIKIVAVDDGYKFSDRKGKNWMKMDGATLTSVDSESDASVFSIEPSQYYIKSYETEKGTPGTNVVGSLAKYQVSCDSGVVSGFKFTKDGSKYKYGYDCAEGEAASGDLNEKTLNTAGNLDGITRLVGDSFKVNCGDTGALANFRILAGTGENNASYEYTCRDVNLIDEDPSAATSTIDTVEFVLSDGETQMEKLAGYDKLVCNEGSVLTGFNYSSEDGDSQNVKLSGICKKLAT